MMHDSPRLRHTETHTEAERTEESSVCDTTVITSVCVCVLWLFLAFSAAFIFAYQK